MSHQLFRALTHGPAPHPPQTFAGRHMYTLHPPSPVSQASPIRRGTARQVKHNPSFLQSSSLTLILLSLLLLPSSFLIFLSYMFSSFFPSPLILSFISCSFLLVSPFFLLILSIPHAHPAALPPRSPPSHLPLKMLSQVSSTVSKRDEQCKMGTNRQGKAKLSNFHALPDMEIKSVAKDE